MSLDGFGNIWSKLAHVIVPIITAAAGIAITMYQTQKSYEKETKVFTDKIAQSQFELGKLIIELDETKTRLQILKSQLKTCEEANSNKEQEILSLAFTVKQCTSTNGAVHFVESETYMLDNLSPSHSIRYQLNDAHTIDFYIVAISKLGAWISIKNCDYPIIYNEESRQVANKLEYLIPIDRKLSIKVSKHCCESNNPACVHLGTEEISARARSINIQELTVSIDGTLN